MFELDQRLAQSSAPLVDLRLCLARLQLDARFPWIVLVPRRGALRELEDLAEEDLHVLTDEILCAGRALREANIALGWPIDKLNVGALGNVVPQLHIHVVGRRVDDPAWPAPVWGHGAATDYSPEALNLMKEAICVRLSSLRRPG